MELFSSNNLGGQEWSQLIQSANRPIHKKKKSRGYLKQHLERRAICRQYSHLKVVVQMYSRVQQSG